MDKILEAKEFLKEVGMPDQQQNDICAISLLTLANIHPEDDWENAKNPWIRIHDILEFAANYYGHRYAENTRETIRKNCMHQLRDAAIVEDNGKATNSPNYRYRLTPETLEVVKTLNSISYIDMMNDFHEQNERLIDKYSSKKLRERQRVYINGDEYHFGPGKHNALQKAIIEEFAPRFAPYSECLYIGDTVNKDLVKNTSKLREIGFEITLHDKMPDVVLYRSDRDWLYFVEAVTSVGPMSPKRILEIQEMTQRIRSGKIFVTAFLDMTTYRKFVNELAWDTEVWIAEEPEHMIHLNGDRFMGPR